LFVHSSLHGHYVQLSEVKECGQSTGGCGNKDVRDRLTVETMAHYSPINTRTLQANLVSTSPAGVIADLVGDEFEVKTSK